MFLWLLCLSTLAHGNSGGVFSLKNSISRSEQSACKQGPQITELLEKSTLMCVRHIQAHAATKQNTIITVHPVDTSS
jgi:hypothetical protein